MLPNAPKIDQHVAFAGTTGSGKTTGAMDMLSRRITIPWLMIDHKRDPSIAKMPKETWRKLPIFLPTTPGLYHVAPDTDNKAERLELEALLHKIFERGKFGVYVDEGHLFGASPMIRKILVAGRSKKVPLMWVSQRAQDIDPFIWSQSTFYRAYALRGVNDVKRFNDNFPERYTAPPLYHSHYYDGTNNTQHMLGPSGLLQESINRIDGLSQQVYRKL